MRAEVIFGLCTYGRTMGSQPPFPQVARGPRKGSGWGMRDHAGVEQRYRLERIFLGEIGAREQHLLRAHRPPAGMGFDDIVIAALEPAFYVAVPVGKADEHAIQLAFEIRFAQV